MDTMLDLYQVIAERETGFWITLPTSTGLTVSREEWFHLNQVDPDHCQIIAFAPDAHLPLQSMTDEVVVEQALSVCWLDEMFQ
ncbi:MAG: hypothetical protein AB1807_04225 [Pseudomonadota bacterium]